MNGERSPISIAEDLRAASRRLALVEAALVEIAADGPAAVAAREILRELAEVLVGLANEVSPPYAGGALADT